MFVSCKHLKVIVKAIIKVIVMVRTKRGKILFKSRIKGSLLPTPTPFGDRDLCPPPFGDKGDTTHRQRGSLWVKSQGITPGHNEPCSSQKPSLQDPSWLRGAWAPRRGSQGSSAVEKGTRYLAKGRQRPSRTDLYKWLNLFTALLLLSREDAHTLSLCFASSSSKHTVSLFALSLVVVLCL